MKAAIHNRAKKTAPGVRNGRVKQNNRWIETKNHRNSEQKVPLIVKEPPGRGYKHFLKKQDVLAFIDLLPDWERLSTGLNAIVLAPGHWGADGFCDGRSGVIEICAWERDMWTEFIPEAYDSHRDLFDRLGVACENRKTYYLCKFDEKSIKAYQLLHVFLHELGHHYDRMTTKRKKYSSRGEQFAEDYALQYEHLIFNRYFERFGY